MAKTKENHLHKRIDVLQVGSCSFSAVMWHHRSSDKDKVCSIYALRVCMCVYDMICARGKEKVLCVVCFVCVLSVYAYISVCECLVFA